MGNYKLVLCLLSLVTICISAHADIELTSNGKSKYQIVIAGEPSEVEKHAAKELQSFLKKISNVELPIISDSKSVQPYEIILGNNKHMRKVAPEINFKKLGKEGFTIKTSGKHLLIAGSGKRGLLYGVYAFLEEYLECRWYSSKVSFIPRKKSISLPAINNTQIPVLEYREVYYADPMDSDFAARCKLNGNASTIKNAKMVKERHCSWGTWCHTAFSFIPPNKYFKDHPEYYSFIGGKRVTKQLCWSNPEVFNIVIKRMKEMMANPVDAIPFSHKVEARKGKGRAVWEDGEDRYWDVSQMDVHRGCKCAKCKALDDKEGTHMGSLLTFLNKVAAEFPDKTISTLSYTYTRKPPKNLRPAQNVSIMLCNIECTRGIPLERSPFGPDKAFRNDIKTWSGMAEQMFIWDYIVNFSHLYAPNPNLRIQKPNIKFFIKHKVKGIFAQGSREVGGEFCELRNYLVAKLLWNPDANVDEIIDDFLKGYYGPAAAPIRKYIDLMHDTVEAKNERTGIYESPKSHKDGYLSPAMIKQYDLLFDKAEKLVKDDKELLFRVQSARMPLIYVKLYNKVGDAAERMEELIKFEALCKKNKVSKLSEGGNPPSAFVKKHKAQLSKCSGVKMSSEGGFYSNFDNVNLKMDLPAGATEIRYSLDGSNPTAKSKLYKKAIKITGPITVKARAFQNGKVLLGTSEAKFRKASAPLSSEKAKKHDNDFE